MRVASEAHGMSEGERGDGVREGWRERGGRGEGSEFGFEARRGMVQQFEYEG